MKTELFTAFTVTETCQSSLSLSLSEKTGGNDKNKSEVFSCTVFHPARTLQIFYVTLSFSLITAAHPDSFLLLYLHPAPLFASHFTKLWKQLRG